MRTAHSDQISKKKRRAHLTTNSQIQNATADGGELATILHEILLLWLRRHRRRHHQASPVDLTAYHGRTHDAISSSRKRLRNCRREITTRAANLLGKSAGRQSNCISSKTNRFEYIPRQRGCRESRPSSNACTRMFSKYRSEEE